MLLPVCWRYRGAPQLLAKWPETHHSGPGGRLNQAFLENNL